MTRARVFNNNRCQAVRLPKEFRFGAAEVFVRRVGRDLVLSARPADWSEFLQAGRAATGDFCAGEPAKTRHLPAVAQRVAIKKGPSLDRWGLPRG